MWVFSSTAGGMESNEGGGHFFDVVFLIVTS